MKKRIFLFGMLILLALSVGVTIKSTNLTKSISDLVIFDVESLAFSNEKAGEQGCRHPQAVQCDESSHWFNTGWSIKAGCCYGWEECSFVGCGSENYSCDGVHW